MADEPKTGGDIHMHAPLPYRVVLRASVSDDSAPERFEKRVVAYSLMEAMMQAIMEATGAAPETGKYQVESIAPDVPAWREMTAEALRQAVKR